MFTTQLKLCILLAFSGKMTPTFKGYVFIGVSEDWRSIFRLTLVQTLALDSPLVLIQIYDYPLIDLIIILAGKKRPHSTHFSSEVWDEFDETKWQV